MSRLSPIYVGGYRGAVTSITSGQALAASVLWKSQAVGAGSVLGSRIHSMYASSNTTSPRTLNLGRGHLLLTQDVTATGAMAITGNNTITRANGSFITSGFEVGQRILIENPTTTGNRVLARITAVAALSLTFAAATFSTNESLPTAARIHLVSQLCAVSVGSSAGQSASVSAVNLLTNTLMPWLANRPDANMILGPTGVIIGWVSTAMSAGETLEVTIEGGDHEA